MRFSSFFLSIVLLGGCAHSPAPDRLVAFSAKHATEATLTFSHEVEIESDHKPSVAEARAQIESQVLHLFGPMERADVKAAPKEDHTISNVAIRKAGDGLYLASYDYEGTIVVEKGPRSKYDVLLPNNPATIFQKAMVHDHNPCTDDHYQTEGDFWYFWSPAPSYPNCRLKEGEDYRVVHAKIEREKNTRTSYPEYDRLANKGEIRIDVYFGMDDPGEGHDPDKSKDINAESFRSLRKRLQQSGYEISEYWTKEEIFEISPRTKVVPYVITATKDFGEVKISVRAFFGETGVDENSTPFHYFLRDSLKNSSVMVYDGHSGLGGHLDLKDIAEAEGFRFSLPKNRYQIYFFNSCTSYTYYNALYFQRKRKSGGRVDPAGTKNLDILANGLSSPFDTEQNATYALIGAIENWAENGKWTSYQKLAKTIDEDNLFTVNGDEDNPAKPR